MRYCGERCFTHQARAQTRQLAFARVRKPQEQFFCNGAIEHPVAEEFESLVVRRAVAAMGQRLLQQRGVGEVVADALL